VLRLCFVCLGNICRSPTAEGIMGKLIDDADLGREITVDSAGTGAWHAGERADRRSAAEARRHGIELTGRARQFQPVDFGTFDLILAMDRRNLRDLRAMATGSPAGAGATDKIHLLRSFDPARDRATLDVPDPYLGDGGFTLVFDLIDAACRGLLDHLHPPADEFPLMNTRR
jgi:protein-tyrosine phosphatase